MTREKNGAPSAWVFDLGGVVFDIDFRMAFGVWAEAAGVSADEIGARFSFDAAYRAFEKGDIETSEYFEHLRVALGIDIGFDDFSRGWNAIFLDEIVGMSDLLNRLGSHVRLFAFSNTNRLHQEAWSGRYAGVLQLFEDVVVSWRLRHRKPDPQAFLAMAGALGVEPADMVFFDDLPDNVEGARKAGIEAVRVTSFDAVRAFAEARLPAVRA